MRAFYRAAAGESARPTGREPYPPIASLQRTNYFTSCAKMTMRPAMDTAQAAVRSQMIPAT
jgi:hypothetical protein